MMKIFLTFLIAFTAAAQTPVKLSYGKVSRDVMPVFSGDQDFIPIREIITLLDAGSFENTAKRKMVISVPGHQVKITGGSAFIVIDEKDVLQMPVECQYVDGSIFVPVSFFLPILNACLANPILVNGIKSIAAVPVMPDTGKATISEKKHSLTAIAFDKKTNGLLIKLKTEKEFSQSDVEIWRNKNWLYVTISGAAYNDGVAADLAKGEQFRLIKEALIFQNKNSVQLSFQLTNDLSGQEVSVDSDNDLIQIALRVKDPKDLDASGKTPVNTNAQKDKWKIDKIVLDAGHGGKDNGAKGKNGTKEKDVTLAIILKLGKLVEERLKIPVEYTRSTDVYITLDGRTRYANQKNAKLFVSVHCNSNTKRTAHGFEIFFLSPSRNDEALAVARKENEVIEMEEDKHKYGDFTDEKFILANIMQSVFVKESEELAFDISKGIDQQIDLENRGVSQAPFYVLMGASMPSVLVETAFISNPTEESFLKSEAGQQKLAEGILEGLRKFIDAYNKAQ